MRERDAAACSRGALRQRLRILLFHVASIWSYKYVCFFLILLLHLLSLYNAFSFQRVYVHLYTFFEIANVHISSLYILIYIYPVANDNNSRASRLYYDMCGLHLPLVLRLPAPLCLRYICLLNLCAAAAAVLFYIMDRSVCRRRRRRLMCCDG